MPTNTAVSQPCHFGSRELPKSHWTHLTGRHTQDISPHDQNSLVCRVEPPIDRLLGKFPTCHQVLQDTYQETQRVEHTTLKV